MKPPSPRISEEDYHYAIALLRKKFNSAEDLRRYWQIAGSSAFPGPSLERCRPWEKDLP